MSEDNRWLGRVNHALWMYDHEGWDVRKVAEDLEPTPSAADVREALADLIEKARETWSRLADNPEYGADAPTAIADAILAAFEVRPRGTVTDHPATYDGNLRCAFCGKIMGLEGRGSSSERWVHL